MPATIHFNLNYRDPELDFPQIPLSTNPSWIRVTVEGAHAIMELYLPTNTLENLEDAYWGNWISTIQSPILGRCDVPPNQRQHLLDLVLAYHAFMSGTANVPDIWFTNLVRSLINIVRGHSNRPIDGVLTTLTNGLCSLLPQDIFDAPNIPPVTADEPGADADGLANNGVPGTAVPEPDVSLDHVYAMVLCGSVDEGYDLDEDTMPSLAFVEDSSEDEEYYYSKDD